MGGRDLAVDLGVAGQAAAPIENTVGFGVNCRLTHGLRKLAIQRFDEVTSTLCRVAIWQHAAAVPVQNLLPDQLSSFQHGTMGRDTVDGRGERNHGSDAIRILRSY